MFYANGKGLFFLYDIGHEFNLDRKIFFVFHVRNCSLNKLEKDLSCNGKLKVVWYDVMSYSTIGKHYYMFKVLWPYCESL